MLYSPDIVCVGDIMVEFILPQPSLPPPDTTLVIDPWVHQVGGPAYNICWHLSNLGRHPLLVGTFGNRGRSTIEDALTEAKLDNTGLIGLDSDTDTLVSLLVERHHHSIYLRSAIPESISEEIISKCGSPKLLVLTGSRHITIRTAMRKLSINFEGELLVFNPSYAVYEYRREELVELIANSNVVLANEQELRHLCKLLDTEPEALAKMIRGRLLVTQGERGLQIYEKDSITSLTAHSSAMSNTIGAGDAFLAGFLYEDLKCSPTIEAANFGLALASIVVESSSIRPRITEDQVRHKLPRNRG